MKIIIFGTGSTAESVLLQISQEIEIAAVSDNDKDKWNKNWNGYKVISPFEINQLKYDYILICSMFTEEIIESLIQKGVKREKIIPYFNNIDWQSQQKKEKEIKNVILKPSGNRKIALLSRRNSGCNCLALYKNIPEYIRQDFDVELVNYDEYKRKWKEYEVAFTTHFEGRFFKNRINIETWHGFPLKTLGPLEKNCTDRYEKTDEGIDYILSYSKLYTYMLSSIFNIDINKFVYTGMPRNDLLLNVNAKKHLAKIIKRELSNKKVIFYVPTFRRRKDKDRREGKPIYISKIFSKIDKYMEDFNCFFIVKQHPVEGDLIYENQYKNIFFLTDDDFNKNNIDFYETLGASDLLVTDYSSVYFDYLLLNKPIIFWTSDLDMYEERRGFLFEHIEQMMPGPHVKTVNELLAAISKFLIDFEWYSFERNHIKKLVHAFDDFNSSKRVWDTFISLY